MAQTANKPSNNNSKRKEPPQNKPYARAPKRQKTANARQILTQTSDAALSAGELDLSAFLRAREFEIKALEDGMRRAKGALAQRAFQAVPREMRRRTASHNVKKVPKRMQKRAAKEMRDDNTPTVVPGKRKPTSTRGRIRVETAKRLRQLALKKRAEKEKGKDGEDTGVAGRVPRPKARQDALRAPPIPASKFRKRQINKTWLPTHMFHAKRATMTQPSHPLWRFSLPLTPTQKCYRPMHRATGARGAVAWDMSYMSTIGLQGSLLAVEKVLKGVGVDESEKKGQKWRNGKRTWSGWVNRDDNGQRRQICPATIIWCAPKPESENEPVEDEPLKKAKKPQMRKILIRVHPSAFLELWTELLKLSKLQRPIVHLEDLRFEIGSIEITGPAATEALIGTLHPFKDMNSQGQIFRSLAGVTNASALPPNIVLEFSVMDPRLRYPPRKIELPNPGDQNAAFELLETLSQWPVDKATPSAEFFSRDIRHAATRLPSQKSINRRKALAPPGSYPSPTPADPAIPLLLYPTRMTTSTSAQGSWVLLAPWKCILTIWHSLMHFPLSTGGNPRFGGVQETRQVHFEQGIPWFPGDYPAVDAGWRWELEERARRKKEWDARPKSKRVAWESLDLGAGRKGEVGMGWACNFEILMDAKSSDNGDVAMSNTNQKAKDEDSVQTKPTVSPLQQIQPSTFQSLITDPDLDIPKASLISVLVSLFSRGVPEPCARIYRLPSTTHTFPSLGDPANTSLSSLPFTPAQLTATNTSVSNNQACPSSNLRAQWLALDPLSRTSTKNIKPKLNPKSSKAPNTVPPADHRRAIAQELFSTSALQFPAPKPESLHPLVPGEEDLIGFVTSGSFNLAEGKGSGIGAISVERVLRGWREEGNGDEKMAKKMGCREQRLCIVRSAGETVGRLGIWEVV
jgi:ribonuclease P/MRP protein subunit POP1